MKFPFLFETWPWPRLRCATSPATLSFRATTAAADNIRKTIKYSDEEITSREPESSSEGLMRPSSERFFFAEPGRTNSILEEAKTRTKSVTIYSADPILDFRASMEEMAEAHALKDWDSLEKLLSCYLRLNGKINHGYIIGAFVDLIFHLALDFPDESDDTIAETTTGYSDFTSPFCSISSCSSSTYSSATC